MYQQLDFSIQKETNYKDNTQIVLFDSSNHSASRMFSVQSPGNGGIADQWTTETFNVGSLNASEWTCIGEFDWTQISRVAFFCFAVDVAGSGSFWVDKLFFGGLRYSSLVQDADSQAAYGLREYTDTNEELWSDNECMLNALATLKYLKDPSNTSPEKHSYRLRHHPPACWRHDPSGASKRKHQPELPNLKRRIPC